MQAFTYYTPTTVYFGKNTEHDVGKQLKSRGAQKVLVLYGGESAKRSGLLGRVEASLKVEGLTGILFGGIQPNPVLSKVYEGIDLCRAQGVDYLLAVGGGSVIDTAKAIAYGAKMDGDVWSVYEGAHRPTAALPVACVLTIAAAGSEMSDSSVITNDTTMTKRGFSSPLGRCTFAVMNPELTETLPAYQTAVGIADILMHTMERYFTPEAPTMAVTDGIAESLLRSVMAGGLILSREPENYNARAEVMWAGSLSHNGLTGAGNGGGDWACHQLGHELSGKFGLAHGASLSAVWGSWARYVYTENPERFARFAVKVMGIEPEKGESAKALALRGIEEMEGYFWSLDLPTTIAEAELRLDDATLEELAERCSFYGKRTIGGFKTLDKKDIAAIYKAASKEQ